MQQRPDLQLFPALQGFPLNQWYVAAFSDEVGQEPLSLALLGVPLIFYRTEAGAPVALYDRCPHRGLPFSMGKRVGDGMQCGYHGMEFGPDGACTRIPSQDVIPRTMRVKSYPLVERWRWIWIWPGDPDKADESLLPDHDWLGLTREGYHPTPFFRMEVDGNYQFLHDNLLDSTHVSFLHTGALDSGDEMASATITIEEEGQILRMIYATPGSRFPDGVARYFRVTPGKPYDRVLINETFCPSVSIGKQSIVDPEDPDAKPSELYAINALTPIAIDKTMIFHVQITSFDPQWGPGEIENAEAIVRQDKVAVEAMQQRFRQYGDVTEFSVKADNMGIRSRRAIDALIRAEREAEPAA
jgi:phenylpropionate dioxygenase-like ring-hydroxylating dioxygenase large terminal subunit